MKKMRTVALATAFLLPVLSACGTTIQVKNGEVSNASEFLAETEKKWRETLKDTPVTVADDAGCFYVLPDESEFIDEQVACGPALRGQAAANELWDIYKYDTQGTSDGINLAEPWESETSATRPAKAALVDADGNEAPKDPKLASPPLPEAPAGIVLRDSGVETIGTKELSTSIITPELTLTLTSLGTAKAVGGGSLPDEQASSAEFGELYGPAAGEQFFVARYTVKTTAADDVQSEATSGWATGARDAEVSATLLMGEVTRPVDSDVDLTSGDHTLIISAPKETESLRLSLAVDGRSQHLDLVTGERAADPVADTWYREGRVADLDVTIDEQEYEKGDFSFTWASTVSQAVLSPYEPYLGWAPEGKAWMTLVSDTSSGSTAYDVTWQKGTRTATVDGTAYTPVDSESSNLVFQVPATVTEAKVSIAPSFSFSNGFHWSEPASGSVTGKPSTFSVLFQ